MHNAQSSQRFGKILPFFRLAIASISHQQTFSHVFCKMSKDFRNEMLTEMSC